MPSAALGSGSSNPGLSFAVQGTGPARGAPTLWTRTVFVTQNAPGVSSGTITATWALPTPDRKALAQTSDAATNV